MKRVLLAAVTVFVAWSLLDFLLHGMILQPTYEATAALWRPMPEMKMGLMHLTNAFAAIGLTILYSRFVQPKSLRRGLNFGALWGLIHGITMGYGSYSYMPIPYHLAFAWFAGSVVAGAIGGIMLGALVKDAA